MPHYSYRYMPEYRLVRIFITTCHIKLLPHAPYRLVWTVISHHIPHYRMVCTVIATRKLISSSSFHHLDMLLVVAEALNPNEPNHATVQVGLHIYCHMPQYIMFRSFIAACHSIGWFEHLAVHATLLCW